MKDPKANRSWTIAAATATAGAAMLSLGLFLAVGRDSLADPAADNGDDRHVQVITISGDDADAVATFEANVEGGGGKGGYFGLTLREYTKSSEGGALVTTVVDDSPAAKAGVKKGDVIVGFGADVVRGPAKVTEMLRAAKPGDKVMVDVRRDGKVQKLTVELGQRPAMAWRVRTGDNELLTEESERAIEESLRNLEEKTMPDLEKRLGSMKFYAPGRNGVMIFGRHKPLLGIEMIGTTPELREALGGSKEAGVLVGKVLAGSAAEKGGLKVGDLILSVDGEKVSDPGDLSEVIGKHEGQTVGLEIIRDKKAMHLKAVLPKIDEPVDEPTGPRASARRVPAVAPCAAIAIRSHV